MSALETHRFGVATIEWEDLNPSSCRCTGSEQSPKRLAELASFFGNGHNVIQNPLLCASRDAAKVSFEATGDGTSVGTILPTFAILNPPGGLRPLIRADQGPGPENRQPSDRLCVDFQSRPGRTPE